MKKTAMIMAGGIGRRAGGEMPKQLQKLLGIPMLWWSVRAFRAEDADTRIIIVMHPDWIDTLQRELALLPEEERGWVCEIVAGGESRGDSVRNGLRVAGCGSDTLVAVHDAARPGISVATIRQGWEAAGEGISVPTVPMADSLRQLDGGADGASHAIDRSKILAVQTPQTARADVLHEAYQLGERPEFTDDASRVEALGRPVTLFNGEAVNMKVTGPRDRAIAELMISERLR